MSSFPHFFGFDFSAALPWTVSGFLAGLLLSWLWRALRGSRADAIAQRRIGEIETQLVEARNQHQLDVTRLLEDARSFEKALADAERRAAAYADAVPRLKDEIGRLAKLEGATRAELLACKDELVNVSNNLRIAEASARTLSNERQSSEQQLAAISSERQALAIERQKFAADLATSKTAAELKDAEIARLINQVQWHEAREASWQEDKTTLAAGFADLKSAEGAKDAELAGLKNELTAVAQRAEQARKDLDYVRNLAYWQASEIDRLRGVYDRLEGGLSSKTAALANLEEQHAALKARLRGGSSAALTRNRAAFFRRQGTNGTSFDAHAHAKGAGKTGFAHRSAGATSTAKKLARAKAYKPGSAIILGGRGGKDAPSLHFAAAKRRGVRALSFGQAGDDVAALKAKIAALTAEAENYRRFRDALAVANQIAGTGV